MSRSKRFQNIFNQFDTPFYLAKRKITEHFLVRDRNKISRTKLTNPKKSLSENSLYYKAGTQGYFNVHLTLYGRYGR